jgi:integrase
MLKEKQMENIEGKYKKQGLSLNQELNRNETIKGGDYLIRKSGKRILNLKQSGKKGLLIGKKKGNIKYTVRTDRRRYFFPNEWEEFISKVNNKKHKFFFITSLHTGGRIMEVLNLKYEDINIERGTINFKVVKQRKANKRFATGKSRDFFVAGNFIKEYKSFIRGKKINPKDYIFLDNDKIPKNYNNLDNKDKKKYYISKVVSYSNILKRKLKKTSIKDFYNFSPHNLRKTYGMWMRIFNINISELCYRMGHDTDTYMAHYGSSLIFTENERRRISKILGDVK